MRILRFVLVGSLALGVAACGLDANGLGGDDDGGVELTEAGPAFDGTVPNQDASGVVDGTTASDTGPAGDDASGDDVVTPEDGGGHDAADATVDGGDGSEGTDASDASEALDASDASDASVALDASDASDAAEIADASDASDAADAADACGPVEICNNGIDDNCNALIDCADPECTPGWTCTAAAVPSGWVVVEYSEATQPACTTGYGAQLDAVQGPDAGPASCSCGCNITTHGSCEEGTFQVTTNELSIGCGLVGVTGVADGGACLPTSPQYAPANGAEMKVAEVPYAPGVCTGVAPPPTLPPVTYAAQGRICKDTNGTGAGCANSGACVPAATGFSLCITPSAAPTVQACPAGFTNPYTVGDGVNDGRGCTACTCTGPTATCANAELTLFTTSNCSGTGESVPADDTCTTFPGPTGSFGSGPNYVAYVYSAQVQNEACTPSPVAPTDGGVTLKGTRSVCCQ